MSCKQIVLNLLPLLAWLIRMQDIALLNLLQDSVATNYIFQKVIITEYTG